MSVLEKPIRPEVSVIIPAYNIAPFIAFAVESVLTQDFTELEVIVVDDGSTDGTAAELSRFHDDRLKVMKQDNAGEARTRNIGIERTSAPFVAFLDGDDFWDHSKLTVHVNFLKAHPDIDLTFSHSCVVDEAGKSLGRFSQAARGVVPFRELFIENVVSNGSAVVMRREALLSAGMFDPDLVSAADHELWLRVALLRPNNVFCIPQVLTYYRMREGQLTKDWRRMERGWLKLVEKMRVLAPFEVSQVEGRARCRYYRYLAYIAYESHKFNESRSLLRDAIRANRIELLTDRRMWILTAALLMQLVLPRRVYTRLDTVARNYRARRAIPGRA